MFIHYCSNALFTGSSLYNLQGRFKTGSCTSGQRPTEDLGDEDGSPEDSGNKMASNQDDNGGNQQSNSGIDPNNSGIFLKIP